MNWNSPLDIVVNLLAAGAALGFLAFVVIYGAFSNWRATPPGRSVMYVLGSLDAITIMLTIHLFTGPYPGIEFVRIVVYGALLVSSWRLVTTLVQILRGGDAITVNTLVEPKQQKE
jgi:hypothetical protein